MPDLPPLRFGVSEFTTNPWSFARDVETYARLGVAGIEVCEFKLDEARVTDQLASAAARGLTISSAQPVVRTLFPSQSQPAPPEVPARMARFRETIARFGAFARDVPFVTNTGIPPDGNIQRTLETAATAYRALADFAGVHGARIALEPLNASIMNVESAIWTLPQALEVVAAVDRPNFGVCLDLWNVWQNADIASAIAACGDRIFVVQLSDWRTPRSYQDRLIVGQGAIPLPPLLRAIYLGGFRGVYSVEIFSKGVPDALWEGDLERVITESRAGMEAAWRQAFTEPQ
jgi:sugar phosphate isomerase/epimerase